MEDGEELGSAASKNLPAYGAWNADKVVQGTGETLPDPAATSRRGSQRPYKRAPRSRSAVRRESEGVAVPMTAGQHNPVSREGPLLRACVPEQVRAGECR